MKRLWTKYSLLFFLNLRREDRVDDALTDHDEEGGEADPGEGAVLLEEFERLFQHGVCSANSTFYPV